MRYDHKRLDKKDPTEALKRWRRLLTSGEEWIAARSDGAPTAVKEIEKLLAVREQGHFFQL